MRGTNSGKQRLAVHLRRNEGKVVSAQFTSVNVTGGKERVTVSIFFRESRKSAYGQRT